MYLDHAATTPVRPEVVAAMAPFHGASFGNPSGVHDRSRRAKNAIEEARETAAEILGASHPLEIVFTGSGTEADNLAVAGAALSDSPGRNVVTAATEHHAVLETAAFVARLGGQVSVVGVDGDGRVDVEEVVAAVDGDTAVVSIMAANNEVGTLQPIAEIARASRLASPSVVVHTDAVQAFVSEAVTVDALDVDLLSLSAHKFGGPQGTGLLWVRSGVELEPVLHGGGQELGRRSGTHDVAGIVGMAAAMRAAVDDRSSFRARVGAARDRFEQLVLDKVPGVSVTSPAPRLVQHSHLRFAGRRAETMLIQLDAAGVSAAAGSACHSGAIDPSHVLLAMGLDAEAAAECVRFTFGWSCEELDGEEAAARVIAVLGDAA